MTTNCHSSKGGYEFRRTATNPVPEPDYRRLEAIQPPPWQRPYPHHTYSLLVLASRVALLPPPLLLSPLHTFLCRVSFPRPFRSIQLAQGERCWFNCRQGGLWLGEMDWVEARMRAHNMHNVYKDATISFYDLGGIPEYITLPPSCAHLTHLDGMNCPCETPNFGFP